MILFLCSSNGENHIYLFLNYCVEHWALMLKTVDINFRPLDEGKLTLFDDSGLSDRMNHSLDGRFLSSAVIGKQY